MTKELVEKADSAQVLLDFMRGDKQSFAKPFSPKTALNIVRNDPTVAAAIDRKTNKVLEGGWSIRTKRGDSTAVVKKFKRKYKFNNLLRSTIRTGQWQDVLIEIVKKNGEVTDLNLLDPAAIDVITDSNGDVIRYEQTPHNDGKKRNPIVWSPEQVVHIKFKDAILNFWGESDLKVAYDTVLIKDYIRQYLTWLFSTNQFRTHFNIKDASEQQIRNFISRYKAGESTYDKPVITEGEVQASPLRDIKDLNELIALLEWCDKQLISLLQTTVVAMGWGGSGGRSESDSLGDDLRTSIIGIQRTVADAINYDLLEKMGYSSNDEFYWYPLDRMTKKQLFETIEIMRRSGWKDEVIKEFAESEGLSFDPAEWFKEDNVEPVMSSAAKKDGSFSRQRSSEGEADKNVGTGQESSTKASQLVSKAKFDTYPYTYEVSEDAL